MIRIASPAEHGADMVKPAVYPFKCIEWDLATARPPAHLTVPTIAARPVGLSQRERIALARNTYVDAGPAAAENGGDGPASSWGYILMWRLFGKCGEITPLICQARNFGAMITAAQCRSARTLLSWSLNKLASAASVPANVIDSFEMERQRPDAATIGSLQRAFEDVGVEFLPDDDVRVRAATPPDK